MYILKKFFLVAPILLFFLYPLIQDNVFAYDDKTTHPALTDEIVDFYNLSFPNKKLTVQQKEWIVEGAILEDDPPRWINHFYDPIHKDGWTGERAGKYSSSTITTLATAGIFMEDSISAVNWVHNREAQRKYLIYQGDRTWEKAIEYYVKGDQEEAYKTLGHVLHLLEDQSVPDHTRNDTHAHELEKITGDFGSPYEEYLKKYDRKSIEKLNIPALLNNNREKPVQGLTIEDYLISLAKYSNKNFFSKDTINDPDYQFPIITKDDGFFGYGQDERDNIFPIAKLKIQFDINDNPQKLFLLESGPEYYLILDHYFSNLSRQAVLHGAGVIDLFQKQAEEAVLNNKDYSYSGSKFYIPAVSFTAGLIKLYDNGVSIGNTLSSAYDSAKATISNIVTIDITRPVGDFSKSQTASLLDSVSNTEVVVEGPVLVNNTVQGEILDGVSSGLSSETVATTTPNTIQSQALDSTNQSIISQAPVFVGGAMPIVAVPAPVVASQSQTTQTVEQEEQPVVQNPVAEVMATTTPEIVFDTTAPVITILGDNPTTVLVGGQYADLGATALDGIDGARTVSVSSSVNVFTEGDYLVSYTASDFSGNVAHATRTVSVVPTLATFSFSDLNNNSIADNDETDVLVDMNSVLLAGEYRFNNLTIASSSTLTLQGDPLSLADFKGVKIVAQNITVEVGSFISADYQGYKTGGPGSPSAPAYLAGASYGGVGTGGGVPSYGDALTPTELGSNGGVCCGNYQGGGGAMHFIVSGTFLNNGTVSANGSGSSSGGSIYGVVDTLAGSGIFQANGGAHSVSSVYHGRAGGGRTALYYQTSSFSGASTALGGCSSLGMGYAYECAGNGTAGLFDTKNNDLYISSSWRFQTNEGPFNFNRIVVTGGAVVEVEDGVNISAHELSIAGTSTFSIAGSSVINIPRISVHDNATLTFSGRESLTLDTLSVTGNSTISVAQGSPLALHLRNLTISANSKINIDNKGYSGNTGPGAPIEFYDGASHGGVGYNNSATSTYGSITEPVDMGSGGNGHHAYAQGGGALKIIADGTFILDGAVSARGGITSSGGSIYIIAHRLEGNGQIVADGGPSYWQGQYIGPGGGGRIAVTAEQYAFVGSMSALGGCARFDGWTMSCAGNGTIKNSNELEIVVVEEVPVQGVEENPPAEEVVVVLDTTPPVITTGAYDSTTATSSPITVTATTSEGVLNAESHTFAQNSSFDFVATDDAGNTATTTITIENIDTIPPSITSYTLNDAVGNIEMLIASPSPVTLVLHASENVDWVSLRIEHSEDSGIYKTFYSGAECVDGTAICTKVWDTSLSKGDFIEGTYRIKAHVRDAVGNDVTEYLAPYMIVVQGEPAQNEAPAPVLEDLEPVL